jgi:AAA domain
VGVVVEYCGLPGSGKSTLARALVARLRLEGVPTADVMAPLGPDAAPATRVARKAAGVARGMVQAGSPRLVAAIAFGSRQRSTRDRLARPANLLVVRDAVRRARRRPGVSVLDQGPLQEWWSAGLRGDRARVLEAAAADAAECSDLLVRVDAPIDLLVERLGRREQRQSRLEGADPVARRAELESGLGLLDALCPQGVDSEESQRPVVIRVDGLDPTALSVVMEAVRRCGLGER